MKDSLSLSLERIESDKKEMSQAKKRKEEEAGERAVAVAAAAAKTEKILSRGEELTHPTGGLTSF